MPRKTLILAACFLSFLGKSQHRLYAKVNAATLPVLVLNAGFEYELAPHYTLEADGFISPWKSFANIHAQIYMAHLEGRYYFNENFRKFYVGVNAGFGVFDLTKWNYTGSNKFQRGFNLMGGITAGYQFRINDKVNGDVFLRGGTSQGFYHGYEEEPPTFFRYDAAQKWNKSGELIPYGGGLMISYQIK